MHYNNTKIKKLLIDSSASTRSTGGISQLKVLQQLDIFVQLDKNTAGLANFIFEVGNAASIRSINLATPLKLITFYIVPVNILFLLYLADIDKLGVFFNNITNKMIKYSPLNFILSFRNIVMHFYSGICLHTL